MLWMHTFWHTHTHVRTHTHNVSTHAWIIFSAHVQSLSIETGSPVIHSLCVYTICLCNWRNRWHKRILSLPLYTHTHTHTHTVTHTCTHTHTDIHACTHTHTDIHVCTHTQGHTHSSSLSLPLFLFSFATYMSLLIHTLVHISPLLKPS